MHTVIAGGGLVGLSAAASLRRIGHEVTVVEQADEIRAVGAGIGLWANALHEFDFTGIGAAVRKLGHPIDTWFFGPSGQPLRAEGHQPSDYQFLLVPRPQLNTLLAEAAGPGQIRLGTRVTGYDEDDDGVTVQLDGGESLRADLLIGADGVHSRVRAQLLPGHDAQPWPGHFAWRAIVPSGGERPEGTVLTIGAHRTRGGYARVSDGQTMWMINQFDAGPLTGGKRDRALVRAGNIAAGGWHDDLLAMIAATPEDAILENQITQVPELPRWSSARVLLIGDAAHGLSPHIAAGGTLGIEDITVLRATLAAAPTPAEALFSFEAARMPRFQQVHRFADQVAAADNPADFAARYADFSHWMLTTAPA